MTSRRTAMKTLLAAPGAALAQGAAPALKIQHVDIIHHSHTDVGFTDMPSVCRELQVRFLDAALDLCLHDKRFRWTAEATLTVDDWWRRASAARRAELVRMVRVGQMDVMALPFNQAPFMNAMQWRQAFNWLPETVRRQLRPRAAMQNDVNGFPRAGAMGLLDRGIPHLLMGINPDSGGPPFRRPSAFWWKMPDGRRMFVWLGEHYGTAFEYFETEKWIRGQAKAADGALRPPRAGENLKTDEPSLRAAHAHFLSRLQKLEAEGYGLERLILSYTNQWRWDNDPPFPPLPAFIEAWNRLGLQPTLRLATATDAVQAMEKTAGGKIPTFEGEWTDWWANGDASGPREVAASRVAKRRLTAALSPVWGPLSEPAQRRVEGMLKDLCLFDEHTWGANISISQPDSLDTIAQYAEKSLLAYRPMGHSEWLLGQRARTKLAGLPEGLHVTNTARLPVSGWATLQASALRGSVRSLEESVAGTKIPVEKLKDDFGARFWVEGLPAASTRSFQFSASESAPVLAAERPLVGSSARGWPKAALWRGMKSSLFEEELGDFVSVKAISPANRSTISKIHATADAGKREEMRAAAFQRIAATPGSTQAEETPHTLVYTQPFDHPALRKGSRRLELWRREPRARLTVRFDRLSSNAPEVFYVGFGFPVGRTMPRFSNGGVPFVPFDDQLKGSCRDYFAIDGWARYSTSEGEWLWVTRDAPLVTVGGPHTVARIASAPADTNRLMAMVFDNCWHTNFVANSHGKMEFQFELVWRERIANAEELAEALVAEPVVVINPAMKESPEMEKNIFRS